MCLANSAPNPKCLRLNRGFFNKIDVKRTLSDPVSRRSLPLRRAT